jgi:soluble lytic murein transglycosylase-like protein
MDSARTAQESQDLATSKPGNCDKTKCVKRPPHIMPCTRYALHTRPEAPDPMKRLLSLAWLATMAALPLSQVAQAQQGEKAQQRGAKTSRASAPQHAEYDALVATHARANLVPEALVHRVIVRESRYQPALVGRGGAIGLMQIKLATARSLGYTGDAAGLRDPNTNLTYAVRYLAGAYRAANGDHNRTIAYYASGYYQVAKRQRLEHVRAGHSAPTAAPPPRQDPAQEDPADANARAEQVPE